MSFLDYFFLISLGAGFVFGLVKGMFRLLATLAGLVLGIYFARILYHSVAGFLSSVFHLSAKIASPLAFFLLFVAIMLILYLLGRMLTRMSKAVALSWLNRLCGGALGLLQVALVLGVFINLYSSAHQKVTGQEADTAPGSMLYAPLKHLPGMVLPYLDFDKWNPSGNDPKRGNDASSNS